MSYLASANNPLLMLVFLFICFFPLALQQFFRRHLETDMRKQDKEEADINSQN